MDAVVLLADSAQADATGKVHMLGAGWTVVGTPTPAMSLVVLFQLPPGESPPSAISITLRDDDDQVTPLEGGPMAFNATLETIEAGLPQAPMVVPIVIDLLPGIALKGGTAYRWQVEADGVLVCGASFYVRQSPPLVDLEDLPRQDADELR